MRPVLTVLLMATLVAPPTSGDLAAQTSASEIGPVRSARFGAPIRHRPLLVDAPVLGAPAQGHAPQHLPPDSGPADSAGSFLASAGLALVGGVVGLYAGSFVPYGMGILVGPFVGAAFGATAGDRWTGGVDPSFTGALLGAAVGTAAGLGPCFAGPFEYCQGPHPASFLGIGIGAAAGIAIPRLWAGRGSNPRPLD